jgi:hypothetical protein
VRGIFAEGHLLLARTAAAASVLHAPELLAARVYLDVETAAVGNLVRARFDLQSLEFRVIERHASRDSVPHAIFRSLK